MTFHLSSRTIATYLGQATTLFVAGATILGTIRVMMTFVDDDAQPLVAYGQLYALIIGLVGFGLTMAFAQVLIRFREIRERPA